MLNDDGSWAVVAGVVVNAEPLTAYNLTVANFHTYFVAGNANAQPVWVHNDCKGTASYIANGHAGTKHLDEFDELNIYDQDALANHVEGVLEAPTHRGNLERGRSYAYDADTNTLVIVDPSHPDGGTVFRPSNGIDYIDNDLR